MTFVNKFFKFKQKMSQNFKNNSKIVNYLLKIRKKYNYKGKKVIIL